MRLITILLADDDLDECLLNQEALEEEGYTSSVLFHWVKDGEELLDYLHQRGQYHATLPSSPPSLILLDLDMPRKNGWEALKQIKSDPKLYSIPIIVMSSSRSEEEILRIYELGANSFIAKPTTFEGMTKIWRSLHTFWFETVQLPKHNMMGLNPNPSQKEHEGKITKGVVQDVLR